MISKAKSKFIKSLQIKKYRKQEQCFVVEGRTSIGELLHSDFQVTMMVLTPDFLSVVRPLIPDNVEVIETCQEGLRGLGEFQSNEAGLAVVRMKPNLPLTVHSGEYGLVLDDIRDPGNLGTIIRTADWFGVRKIIASPETADFYNSKVLHATMGSFTRIEVFYADIISCLEAYKGPIFGAFLDGQDVHSVPFGASGLIVIGNEAKGISPGIEKLVTTRMTIPKYGQAESLNASIATAVILDNLRRSRK